MKIYLLNKSLAFVYSKTLRMYPSVTITDITDPPLFVALEAVPAEDWWRTWPAESTIMLRKTSKKVYNILKKICPPAFINFNNKWFNISKKEPIKTIDDWCCITSIKLHRSVFSVILTKELSKTFLLHSLTLTRLDMRLNNIGYNENMLQDIAKGIACCKTLQYLDLSQNFIKTAGFYYLIDKLSNCPLLSHLDVSWNMIYNERAASVNVDQKLKAKCLSLTHIDLSFNKIQNNNENNLANLLDQCPNLSFLNLSYNKIGDNIEIQGQCTKLSHLDLRNNNISDVGAQRLANLLGQTSNMSYLDISINHIGVAGVESLKKLGIKCLIFDNSSILE